MLVPLGASPALAAPPTNDTLPGAVAITTIPFSETLDTTEATTDATDAAVNTNCGAPFTNASVWYTYTPSTDGAILVDVSGSDYSAGVIVTESVADADHLVTCGPGAVAFEAATGTTYYILAFSDTPQNGGKLSISVDEAPPPPTVDLTVNPVGRVDSKTGYATITGTVTCTGEVEFTDLLVELRQNVGRFTITGFGFTGFPCDGSTHPWEVVVQGDNGKFAGGKAASVTFAIACGPVFCGEGYAEQRIQLKGGRK